MADFYPYLVASLPMLHFGMKPPFSFSQFLEQCHQYIPENDYQILCSVPQPEQYSEGIKRHPVIQKWIEFDVGLRNEMVKIRAGRKHLDPAMYLRSQVHFSSSPIPIAMAASIHTSLLDAEKSLDEMRWKALDELAIGHYFDLHVLITYAYKLLILHRWENIRTADKAALLEQALTH